MKKTIDNIGRLCIPKSFRAELGITEYSDIEITLEDDKIVITNPKKSSLKEYIIQARDTVKELNETCKVEELKNINEAKIEVYEEILKKMED